MTETVTSRLSRASLSIIIFFFIAAGRAMANGSDLPPEIVLQGFVKIDDGHAHLLLRIPLLLLDNLALPKRGPGFLDLTNIDPKLKQAGVAFGSGIELSTDGTVMAPTMRELRLSLLSDRSFASYDAAIAHLQETALPVDTNLFWNQGFFDAHLEYALQSPRPDLWIRVKLGPDLGQRIKLRLQYLRGGDAPRDYEIPGDSGAIPLDPHGFDAAWLFAKRGFAGVFAVDRLVFLLCLVAPFRRFRGVLALALVLAVLQALTLTATADGALADAEVGWLPVLANAGVAAAMVLLAIANLATPSLRRRVFLTAVVGALGGFGLGRLLTVASQFAGSHPLVSDVSFNVGAAVGEVVAVTVLFFVLRLFFSKVIGPLLGVVVLSALVGHLGWHAMTEGVHDFTVQFASVPLASRWPALGVVATWLAPALVIGVLARFLPRRFDGTHTPTLRDTLQRSGVRANGVDPLV